LGPLDAALATAFAPHRITDTLTVLADSQHDAAEADHDVIRARALLAECNTKLGSPPGRLGGRRRSEDRHRLDRRGSKPNAAAPWPCSTSPSPGPPSG